MNKKNTAVSLAVYTYMALPFIIFAAGFLKWYFAIPSVIVTLIALALSVNASEGIGWIDIQKKDILKFVLGLVIIVSLVLLSGIGNVFWQNSDHPTRNGLFNILVEYSWPPKYTTDGGNVLSIVYYIGFWLPSALVGKLAGLEIGYIFQIVWASLGLFILWYLLCNIHKKIVIYPLVIFLFFSGLDFIGQAIMQLSGVELVSLQKGTWAFPYGSSLTTHLEWWARHFQYSSHTTQLFWVFNQCIPVWIATLVMLLEKTNKNLVFIMGITLLSSTLPFIGLIPIFLWCAVTVYEGSLFDRPLTPTPFKTLKSLFSYQNFFGGGISGILTFLYLRGNIAIGGSSGAQSTSTAVKTAPSFNLGAFFIVLVICVIVFFAFTLLDKKKLSSYLWLIPIVGFAFLFARMPQKQIGYFIMFILFEVVLVALISMPVFFKSSLYWLTIFSLLIVPFFKIGRSIDFCMRASIPLIAVLCIFTICALGKYFKEKNAPIAFLAILILLTGSITPMHEIARTVEATLFHVEKHGEVKNKTLEAKSVFGGKNFSGKTKDNMFFEVFAK